MWAAIPSQRCGLSLALVEVKGQKGKIRSTLAGGLPNDDLSVIVATPGEAVKVNGTAGIVALVNLEAAETRPNTSRPPRLLASTAPTQEYTHTLSQRTTC